MNKRKLFFLKSGILLLVTLLLLLINKPITTFAQYSLGPSLGYSLGPPVVTSLGPSLGIIHWFDGGWIVLPPVPPPDSNDNDGGTPTPAPTPAPTPIPTSLLCGSGIARATGLVSTINLAFGTNFGTTDACIVDPEAAFVSFKIPSYDDLKSIYFTQPRTPTVTKTTIPSDATQSDLNFTSYQLILVTGNLNLSGNPPWLTSPQTGVVFVDGDLNLNNYYFYGSSNAGTVFVVKGNINIAQSVTRIDAVLIAGGTIFTAGANCTTNDPALANSSQLVINGSLIALTDSKPIKFCRKLADNSIAAEKINHQPKYVAILKDIFADSWQKWGEIP